MPDSNPRASQTTYEVESGRMDAANSEAFRSPSEKSKLANLPANGRKAIAAVFASGMSWIPCTYRVAAVQTMMKNTITMQLILPTSTSFRVVGYCLGPTLFSNRCLQIKMLPGGDRGAEDRKSVV